MQTNDAIEISNPDIIINLAAESHVDRSIYNPQIFIDSNINGTFNLLEASLEHFRNLNSIKKIFWIASMLVRMKFLVLYL